MIVKILLATSVVLANVDPAEGLGTLLVATALAFWFLLLLEEYLHEVLHPSEKLSNLEISTLRNRKAER